MEKFWVIIEVLYKGRELKDKTKWKNAQAMTGIFLAMIGAVQTFFPDLPIDAMTRSSIVNGLVAIMGVAGTYLTVATSATVGLPKK
jgi:hypothetical protein